MNTSLSFDDILMSPAFSEVVSRKDVDTEISIGKTKFKTAIISSNMDSVTGYNMANAMYSNGGMGCLHRFNTIEQNIEEFNYVLSLGSKTWVSFGLGKSELERAESLIAKGAETLVLDVAHGASISVVKQVKALQELNKNVEIIVGNFATKETIQDFLYYLSNNKISAFKIGIGGGSACLTRVVTGCGLPTFASILDCSRVGFPIIADGGIRNTGDFCKAMAAGASAVMMGGVLAGTDESLAEAVTDTTYEPVFTFPGGTGNMVQLPVTKILHKRYRGSASKESYEVQGKVADHRVSEGDSFTVPYRGPVKEILREYNAALRSCLSYNGATNIKELQANVQFVKVTSSGAHESGSHGKSK